MNRYLQLGVALSCAATLSGCLMTRGGDLPELPQTPVAPANPSALSYQFNWQTSGKPNPLVGAMMAEPVVGDELAKSGAFKQVSVGQGSDKHVDITVNNHGTVALAVITGVLSGLTLTVLPGYSRDDFDMTAVVSKNGVEVKRYEYTEHVTQVMQLLLVFGMPFVEGKGAPKNAIRDMTKHLVNDMVTDGV